ncbi:MAG: hypothetical protein E2O84_05105 [Bacteroidetes bacterium]|nr:MAG: hypothetical protein E2O84_05105 [Bacteroidota bacterium]
MRHSGTLRLATLLCFLLWLTGCDTLAPEDSVFLTYTFRTDAAGEVIRYNFSANEIQNGVSAQLSCDCVLDIEPFLISRSYSQSEILSATVTAARIKAFFPIGKKLDYLDNARLNLEAPAVISSLIAQDDTFPSAQEVALTVVPDVSVTSHMKATWSVPVLTIITSSLTPGTEYELGIEFTVELEMKGL